MDSIEGEIFDRADREISKQSDRRDRHGTLTGSGRSCFYVRLASVYREFKDVSTFMEELKIYGTITAGIKIPLNRPGSHCPV